MVNTVAKVLDQLEAHYGKQQAKWPTDPYAFLVWWCCGYPQSDDRCTKGWASLTAQSGISPEELLAATPAKLTAALKPGGMVPELRVQRLKELAMRVKDQYAGELGSALRGPLTQARKVLKTFHSISDPGADRILLFAGLAPLAAVPSNNPHVLVRILLGRESENYGRVYKEAQGAIAAEVPETLDARQRAYLLLKIHGQEICKRQSPKCDQCPVKNSCQYFAGHLRGRGKAARAPGSRR